METLKQHIRSQFQLSEQEAAIFLSGFTMVELKKNDVFIPQGQVCHTIGLVEKGLMKSVYDKKGEELVFEFAYENQFITDYYSFVTGTPSAKEIRCLEDTTLYVLTREKLEELCAANPFIEKMNGKTNEGLFIRMHNRLQSLLLDTPLERYQKLIAERADLANRIPQYLVASYLNVQPETISRIRRKIAAL